MVGPTPESSCCAVGRAICVHGSRHQAVAEAGERGEIPRASEATLEKCGNRKRKRAAHIKRLMRQRAVRGKGRELGRQNNSLTLTHCTVQWVSEC